VVIAALRRLSCCFGPPRARPLHAGAAGSDAVEKVASAILSGEISSIIVMCGAGVSVSAGIPDFRTPGTGLYDNLQEYGLPFAEAIFDLGFFQSNPKPFHRLCKELWPGNFQPTPTHSFIRLLHDKGVLMRCFTQNIDSLETAAGLPADKLVAAHGNFDSARVVGDLFPVPIVEVREAAFAGEEAWAALDSKYGGPVKPDIVFFGEALPTRFFECAQRDFPRCDLLLVMGTSLVVHPFASLVGQPRRGTLRLLVNRERVGERSSLGPGGFDFDRSANDLFLGGECDAAVQHLVNKLGWTAEFEALRAEHATKFT